MKQVIKRLKENLSINLISDWEDFLSIKPRKEISREKIGSFDHILVYLQHFRWATDGQEEIFLYTFILSKERLG